MSMPSLSVRAMFGPLRYRLLAHDAWGREALKRLQKGVECVPFDESPHRTIHLLEFYPLEQEWAEIRARSLPQRLAQRLPDDSPGSGWVLSDDVGFGCCWHHDASAYSLCAHGMSVPPFDAPYQLPWALLLHDIARLGGALIHSGLAVRDSTGYLFTSPPGGGKSTALARIPLPWQALSDDAALIWPGSNKGFLASPLPTWGALARNIAPSPAAGRCQIARVSPLSGVIILQQSERDALDVLPPVEAAQHLYRACCEHPTVVGVRHRHRPQLFHCACALARAVPSWCLQLTRSGEYWTLLAEAMPEA